MTIGIDLTHYHAAQDLIVSIGEQLGFSPTQAVDYSICPEYLARILMLQQTPLALLDTWKNSLDAPPKKLAWQQFDLDLPDEKVLMLNVVVAQYGVTIETAISYFLVFFLEDI